MKCSFSHITSMFKLYDKKKKKYHKRNILYVFCLHLISEPRNGWPDICYVFCCSNIIFTIILQSFVEFLAKKKSFGWVECSIKCLSLLIEWFYCKNKCSSVIYSYSIESRQWLGYEFRSKTILLNNILSL